VETYLGQPAEREELASPAAYLAMVAAVDHTAVVDRGREAGTALGPDPARAVRALVGRVPPMVAGDDDPLIPLVNARFLARRIPRARLHVVPGGGHLFLIDRPGDVVRVVRHFLSEPD